MRNCEFPAGRVFHQYTGKCRKDLGEIREKKNLIFPGINLNKCLLFRKTILGEKQTCELEIFLTNHFPSKLKYWCAVRIWENLRGQDGAGGECCGFLWKEKVGIDWPKLVRVDLNSGLPHVAL